MPTNHQQTTFPDFAFFGSSRFSVLVLDELEKAGCLPLHIVTTPDQPQGRKLVLTPTPVKQWAEARDILVHEPPTLDDENVKELNYNGLGDCQLFVVASYGKIIPTVLIDLPPASTLNIHPSLLPRYRGASPLQSAVLDDAKDTGVTIIQIDEKMDHGPIVAQKHLHIDEWPTYEEFESLMAQEGAQLLATIMPDWAAGKINPKEQDHSAATYTKKTNKEDGLIDIADLGPAASADRAYAAFRKIQAYHQWPQAYFFIEKNARKLRVKITAASYTGGRLQIEKVIPEGTTEMAYADFVRGYGVI